MIENYVRVSSIKEALEIKALHGAKAGYLAGGTDINRLNTLHPYAVVIDLQDLGLNRIDENEKGFELGSCVTFQQALDWKSVPADFSEALRYAGSRTLRNSATIGGNIACGLPDSYLLPFLTAAKVRLILADIGSEELEHEESVPIREFTEHPEMYRDSLIVRVVFDKPGRFAASQRFSKSVQGAVTLTAGFGADFSKTDARPLRNVRIALGGTGVGSHEGGTVYRLPDIESALSEGVIQTASELQEVVSKATFAVSDFTGSAEYKKYLAGTAVAQLYSRGLEKAGRGSEL
ncbi:MAG: FAD binding domain-containing protein [Spirochaetia bacterium]|nr:FAD binding domain-containing protein [Spirochaetia bacterium]